jgi:hypothetical protein
MIAIERGYIVKIEKKIPLFSTHVVSAHWMQTKHFPLAPIFLLPLNTQKAE